eukprot:7664589-Alexandrium_andersonii.AAC.1
MALQTTGEVLVARSIHLQGVRATSGEFIFVDGRACLIAACLKCNSDFVLLCDAHDLVEKTAVGSRWRPSGKHCMVRHGRHKLTTAVCWRFDSGTVLVL